jgi:hypothetical protein
VGFRGRGGGHRPLGPDRAAVRLLGHLAAGHQHRDHDRHVPDGFPDPEHTQNRDAKAIHLKLDELLRGVEEARTGMVDLEDCTDEELARYEAEFKRIRALRWSVPGLAEREAREIVEAEGPTSRAGVAVAMTRRPSDNGTAGGR